MNGYALPRAFATLAAICLIAAVVVWPVEGYPYLSGLLFAVACCLAFMSYDLNTRVTALRRRELALSRHQRHLAVVHTPDGDIRTGERRYETWLETVKDHGP